MRADPQPEKERIRAVLAGDTAAFGSLVRQYYNLAYSLAYKLLDDAQDAEEVTQDAFVKIHAALPGFRGEAAFKTWILRIVMRLGLNRRRDRSRGAWQRLGLHFGRDDRAWSEASAPDADPEALYASQQVRQLVRRWVDELPEPLRQAMILNSFEELSYAEIAHILGVPMGTVSSRIHSARKKLLKKFRQHDLL